MSEVIALAYIGIEATDVDAWRTFATDTLGLQAVDGPDGALRLRADERAYRAEIRRADADGLSHLGLEVRDAAALSELAEKLEKNGVAVKRDQAELAARRQVTDLIVVEDPAGTTVEIFYGQMYGETAFVSPTGARFVTHGTKGLGFGHAFFLVPDMEAALAFYTGLLGFRISDRMPEGPSDAYFLRCNPRHHSIGLASVPGMGARLLHIMFEADDLDAVGRAYDKCRDGAATLVNTLGRHSNDEMLSFYVRTPSGFDLEYGCFGLQIDEDSWEAVEHRYPVESWWGHKRTPDNVRGPEPGWQY
ncbi:hypothetical protein ACM01_07985 [Streptomyces viridochromogenes]|uniref:VOC domain-containing protein n=1 Tax=Streptomyces viridochromogenes TaxID=1938 RepID=A0A0J7ZKN8_STRVR|nr:VOC family protein [Streptomyces viridochromogenes]KMS75703.1 hypothetical protein ACM01_07985 [Streptomyces viridochromogenes]KOG07041.1 hypothetical protein ADK35_44665 [Streptomyces viridochromogenes]KOG16905.1 hypothetical protein ADK36_25520 [Streptomyces viridochromogenes]